MAALVATGLASSWGLDVPYTGGKIAGTLVIEVQSATTVSPDSIRFGGDEGATIRFALESAGLPNMCGGKPTVVVQFRGAAAAIWQTPDTSTDWNALTSMYPQRLDLPEINGWDGLGSSVSWRGAGYPLFSAGPRSSCTGDEYVMAPYWNRVVFMSFGAGRDFRGRFSFQVKHDTSYAPTPQVEYETLKSLTLHYVIAEGSDDVSGAPVSLRAPRGSRVPQKVKPETGVDFYDARGVKGRREPGRFESLLPVIP